MKNNHQELNGFHPIQNLILCHKKSEISHFQISKIITKDHSVTMHQLLSKKNNNGTILNVNSIINCID